MYDDPFSETRKEQQSSKKTGKYTYYRTADGKEYYTYTPGGDRNQQDPRSFFNEFIRKQEEFLR
jgi:hypothetical protein